MQTRDEFFEGAQGYTKPGYQNKGYYRKVVVVDSNRNDELAVVKSTTSANSSTTSKHWFKYKPFIETLDDTGNPIKIGKKFKRNSNKKRLSKKDVNNIKRKSVKFKKNRNKLRTLKGIK